MQNINTNTEEYSISLHILNVCLSCTLLLDILLKQKNSDSASMGPDLAKLFSNTFFFLKAQNLGSHWLHQKGVIRERMLLFFVTLVSSFL